MQVCRCSTNWNRKVGFVGYDLRRSFLKVVDYSDFNIVNGEFTGRAFDEGLVFRFNIYTWPFVLQLAVEYGWDPEGTHAPRYDDNGVVEGNKYLDADTAWR